MSEAIIAECQSKIAKIKARLFDEKLSLHDAQNRLRAAEYGDHIYLGAPCGKGHQGKRYTRNGCCVDCAVNRGKPTKKNPA